MSSITKKQIEYIEIMVEGRFGTGQDKEIVLEYLQKIAKSEVKTLSMNEASELINQLLARDVEYDFLCGKKKTIPRWEAHKSDLFGEMEACMHHCPTEVYFGECKRFLAYDAGQYESQDSE